MNIGRGGRGGGGGGGEREERGDGEACNPLL